MVSIVRPSREQIANIAGGDRQIIRALEAVFDAAGQTIPAQVTGAQDSADVAQNTADNAQVAAGSAQASANAAQATADTAKAVTDLLVLGGATNNDLLRFNGTNWVPFAGWSGTFSSMTGQTVTVTKGVIVSVA